MSGLFQSPSRDSRRHIQDEAWGRSRNLPAAEIVADSSCCDGVRFYSDPKFPQLSDAPIRDALAQLGR